jgi:DNA (cytosine-5)-methyltransferase 1
MNVVKSSYNEGSAYYNEHDPKAAAWLRELIRCGHIAPGVVDERDIQRVDPDELARFTQCHFFAGIGGWSYALRLAGWPDEKPVWTGSCPCQPFSAAGKGLGEKDERHLWPAFFRLIAECRPEWVFGEQVASAIGFGWLDGICADLASKNYACGGGVLGAHSVNAPHIRKRLYWVANARCSDARSCCKPNAHTQAEWSKSAAYITERSQISGLADTERERVRPSEPGSTGGSPSSLQGIDGQRQRLRADAGAGDDGLSARPDAIHGGWAAADWLYCRDGKWRPVEPGSFPMADGVPARMVRLRGYGNAIVPQVAAAFILSAVEAINDYELIL